jgi:hypothetical protein
MPDYSFINGARIPNLRAYMGKPNTTAGAKHDIPGTFSRYRLPSYSNTTRDENGSLSFSPAVLEFQIEHVKGNIELPRVNQLYHGKPFRYS